MSNKKQTPLQQIRQSLHKANAESNVALAEELQQILQALQHPWPKALPLLSKLLLKSSNQVTKHHVADIFGLAKDPRVLKLLMRAATAPENSNHSSNFLWPCAAYDCTAHLTFFVRFLLQRQDPGEAMVACLDVIEEMKGPFDAVIVKRCINKLLQRNRNAIPPAWQLQDEVITTQAAYALLDKYFEQIDTAWKAEG